MNLPIAWVEKIFQKLTLTFGRDFTNRWEGIPLEEVKADWAHELRGFHQNPQAIKRGIETCIGGKPPTVHEFKAACAKYVPDYKALPVAKADAEIVQNEISKSRVLINRSTGNKDWAHRLKSRAEKGDKLSRYQIACYREALRMQ